MEGTSDCDVVGRQVGGLEGDSAIGPEGVERAQLIAKGDMGRDGLAGRQNEGEMSDSGDYGSALELPESVARDTVRGMLLGVVGMGIEPRPTERDATPDRLSLSIDGGGRGVENGFRGRERLPVGEVGAMERDHGFAQLGLDAEGGVIGCESDLGDFGWEHWLDDDDLWLKVEQRLATFYCRRSRWKSC